MKIIQKTMDKLLEIECSYMTPREKRLETEKALVKLYNAGKGAGQRVKRPKKNWNKYILDRL